MGNTVLGAKMGHSSRVQFRRQGDLHGRGHDSHGRYRGVVEPRNHDRGNAVEKRSDLRDNVRLRKNEKVSAASRSNQTAISVSRSSTSSAGKRLRATLQK